MMSMGGQNSKWDLLATRSRGCLKSRTILRGEREVCWGTGLLEVTSLAVWWVWVSGQDSHSDWQSPGCPRLLWQGREHGSLEHSSDSQKTISTPGASVSSNQLGHLQCVVAQECWQVGRGAVQLCSYSLRPAPGVGCVVLWWLGEKEARQVSPPRRALPNV